MDRLPRLGKRGLICLLLFTCNYVVSVWRGFLFFWVLGVGYVILLWHFLSLPYNYLFCLCNYYCLNVVVDDIYIRFGTKLYRQIVGIQIGTNCPPLVADFSYTLLRKRFHGFYF